MGPSTVVGLSRQALVTTLVVVMKGRIRDTEKGGGGHITRTHTSFILLSHHAGVLQFVFASIL